MAGIYIHVPFCKRRCGYCNFYSTTRLELKTSYLQALKKELDGRRHYLNGEPVQTIYFGGGTPSLLEPNEIQSVIGTIKQLHNVAPDAEITVEANPDDLTPTYISQLAQTDANRLSIGIQSFDDAMLTLMDNVKDGKVVEGASTNLSGYLYTICWRMALRRGTKSKRAEEAGKMQEPVEEEDTSVEPEEYAEAMAFLDRVFESIPPKCKSILKRFYWDKLPMSEIAAIHGLRNENSAKTTKNRCMDKFKEIAKAMLADDAKADEAVRRTVERNALRDLLEEIRKEKDGEWARAALEDKDKGK